MHRQLIRALHGSVLGIGWLSGLMTVTSVRANGAAPVVAWLENDSQRNLIQISRAGHTVPYDSQNGFQACDAVSRTESAPAGLALIAISTSDGLRYLLDRDHPRITIPCAIQPGFARETVAFFKNIVDKSNMRIFREAVSRGSCPSPNEVSVPLLSPARATPTLLVAGKRSLILTWVGTKHPVDIQIETAGGAPVIHESRVNGYIFRKPDVTLAEGTYRLRLTDPCGVVTGDDNLQVVAVSRRPAMPDQIKALPEPQKTLFFADYLIGLDDGRWGLEGLQLVGALAETDPVARAWIALWADSRSVTDSQP